MTENPLKNKSYQFSLHVVKVCRVIMSNHNEYILTRQLIRAATSVGANIYEAQQPQSRRDFISKLSIAQKEAVESEYWVCLLQDTQCISESDACSLRSQLNEIKAMLGTSIKTTKGKL